jgi:hypothetical protein
MSGILLQQTVTSAFVTLHVGEPNSSANILVAFPVTGFNEVYYGESLSFNQEVNFYFEAGEAPAIEIGTPNTFTQSSSNRFTVSGYLVDLVP